jgi:hypothetical protein
MRNIRDIRNIRNIRIGTSMRIALTLLVAGLTVQITDQLALFGQNSVVPLIIGLCIVVVGVTFFLLLHWFSRKKNTSLPRNDN